MIEQPVISGPEGLLRTFDPVGQQFVALGRVGGGSFEALIGDGVATTFDVEHGLGTSAIVVAAWEVATGNPLAPTWLILDANTVRATFAVAPSVDDVRVVVLASGGSSGGGSSIGQTLQTVKTDTFSATLAQGEWSSDVTGLARAITPVSAASRVRISAALSLSSSTTGVAVRLLRDGVVVGAGDPAGARMQGIAAVGTGNARLIASAAIDFIDLPATTEQVVYSLQLAPLNSASGGSVHVNRDNDNLDSLNHVRATSTITVQDLG